MEFDEKYYTEGNYKDYLQRGPRYERLFCDVIDLLKRISIIDYLSDTRMLDYGCGVGHLVAAAKRHGYMNMVGYDISTWAVEYGVNSLFLPRRMISNLLITSTNYRVCFMLDVLEHMPAKNIMMLLESLDADYIVFRSPVVNKETREFDLEVSRRDVTHITKMTDQEWVNAFVKYHFELFCYLNLATIWHSKEVMATIFKRRGRM